MPDWDDDHVFDRVSACLRTVAGGSGHVAGYDLDRSSFTILERQSRSAGLTAYTFVAEATRYGEFDGPATDESTTDASDASDDPDASTGEPTDAPPTERLEGTVVLTPAGEVAVDDEGRARLEPWRPVPPRGRDRGADADFEDWFADLLDDSGG